MAQESPPQVGIESPIAIAIYSYISVTLKYSRSELSELEQHIGVLLCNIPTSHPKVGLHTAESMVLEGMQHDETTYDMLGTLGPYILCV